MKLLIATPLLPSQSGGPAQYAVGLGRALISKGHQVDTIAFQEVARYPSGVRHFILFLKAYSKVRRVDAVIVLDTLSMALPLVVASRLGKKKVIIRAGGDFVWEQYIERTGCKIPLSKFYASNPPLSLKERLAMWIQRNIVIPLAHAVVFSTQWQRDIWSVPYCLECARTQVIENAYLPYVAKVVTHPNSQQITWIGRDLVLKNVDLLDSAIEKVRKEFPSLEYKKYSSIPHDEVIKILSESRLLVIPSLSEVSPNLALEALALGIPVLMTGDCGIRDVLGDSVVWVDSLNVDDMVQGIKDLMTEEGYAKMRAKAASFKNTRSYDLVVDDIIALLQ